MTGNVQTATDPKTIRLRDSEIEYDILSTAEATTPPDGWMKLNAGRLAKAGAFLKTTEGSFSLAILVLALIASFFAGVRFDRSRNDVVDLGNQRFQIVGMGTLPENPGMFIPIYKNSDKIIQEANK